MEEYVQEVLEQKYIDPSTSPESAGFFFVEKKGGGLRPCIDDRGLNLITFKCPYPLVPLVPSALEQLWPVKIFTKFDLCAYNLIHIRKGDECKTESSMTLPIPSYAIRAIVGPVSISMLYH